MVKEYATRDVKLETLRRIIIECDAHSLPAKKEQLIIFCSEEWGLRRQSAVELLNELQHGEVIFINGDDVWMWPRWEKIKEAKDKEYPGAEEFISIKHEVSLMSEEDKELARKIVANGK